MTDPWRCWPAGDVLGWLVQPSAGASYNAKPGRGDEQGGAPDIVALRDGRRVRIRPVDPGDAPAEDRFIGGLSLDARYYRFHAPIHRLSPDQLSRMVRRDPRQFALVTEPVEGDSLVADARYVLADDGGDCAEFALAIADDWQRAGLGTMLLARLVAHAREHGVRTLHGEVLHDNRAMAALLRRAGGHFVGGGDPRVRRALIKID